jgi:hypothetical protein
MGSNRRDREFFEAEQARTRAASQRTAGPLVEQDALKVLKAWNDRQQQGMPMLFCPTIGAAMAAKHWFLHVRCPACRTTNAIDLRRVDVHPHAALTSLIPRLSCRGCRPNAPFAQLVKLSSLSIADELHASTTEAPITDGTFSAWPRRS